MKRIAVVFLLLVTGLSTALWLKVREGRAALDAPSGGSGVLEGTEIQIATRLASRITAIHVVEGQRVEAAAVLVELDCEEPRAAQAAAAAKLQAAESQAAAAEAQVSVALGAARAAQAAVSAAGAQAAALEASRGATSRQADRLSQLREKGNATEVDWDRATAQLNQLTQQLNALDAQQNAAKGQAEAARAQAEAARQQAASALSAVAAAQADVRRAQAWVRECTLSAPRGGVIETVAFEVGEAVLPGARIMEVIDLDPMETTFFLPNRELGAAAPGKAVTVVADAFPDRRFKGEIVQVASEAEFTPRNVQTREDRDRLVYAVRVRIPNPDRTLRAGMPVEVAIDGTGK
jgi:HlyD family secretion protein